MDPVSILFSVYLNSVIDNAPKESAADAEPQALVITYEKLDIPFQYQAWRILDSSVCETYSKRVSDLTECSIKAKAMFQSLCSELSRKPQENEQYTNIQEMYCTAAESYKPKMASIKVGGGSDELQRARQACNAAVVEAMGRNNAALDVNRGAACKRYKELLDKEYGP